MTKGRFLNQSFRPAIWLRLVFALTGIVNFSLATAMARGALQDKEAMERFLTHPALILMFLAPAALSITAAVLFMTRVELDAHELKFIRGPFTSRIPLAGLARVDRVMARRQTFATYYLIDRGGSTLGSFFAFYEPEAVLLAALRTRILTKTSTLSNP